jgi:AAA domain
MDGYHSPFAKPRSRRFQLIPFADMVLRTTPAYLVKGLLPRTGLIVVWGPPKCGKSFFVSDLMMHVALGWEYRGRRTIGGTVVYCALEGAEGFRARLAAFRMRHLAEHRGGVPFNLVAAPLTLAADAAPLVASVQASLGPKIAPAVVVIDTLNRSLAGSESDDKDMGAYIRAADAIRDAFSCAVIIVHHSGLEGSRPRGHTSLTGAADAQLSVKRDAANNIVVTVEWMKDGSEGEQVVSRLEVVEVGRDDDGDAITSCVVVPVAGPMGTVKASGQKALPKGARIALAALHDVLGAEGQVPPASNYIPSGAKVVTVDQWRDRAIRMGISASEKPDAVRVAFNRASEALVAGKHVAIWQPYVWPCST